MTRPGPARIDLTPDPPGPGESRCPDCGGRPHEAPDLAQAAADLAAAAGPDPHDCDPLCPCPAGRAARGAAPMVVVPAEQAWLTGALQLSAGDEVSGEFLGQPFTGSVSQIVFGAVDDDGPVDEYQHTWQLPVRVKLVELILDEPVLGTRGTPVHRVKIDRDAAARLKVTRRQP